MNKDYLNQLITIGYKQWKDDPQNEVVWEETVNKVLSELTKDLTETIQYIDTCSKDELYFISQVFEELSEHFKSPELLNCVERNVNRFDDPELKTQLKSELKYMDFKKYN